MQLTQHWTFLKSFSVSILSSVLAMYSPNSRQHWVLFPN